MVRALESCGCEVQQINLSSPRMFNYELVAKIWSQLVYKKRVLLERTPRRIATMKKQLAGQLDGLDYDAIVAPSSLYIAALPEKSGPSAFWADACFAGMIGFYDDFSRLTKGSLKEGHAAEQNALRRVSTALYSSDWAATTARKAYGDPEGRIAVVPFGANMEEAPDQAKISAALERRGGSSLRLLFMGVDWKRKGGDYACEVVRQARLRGIPAELDVVGCLPPKGSVEGKPWVRTHGFISKATPEGRQRLETLMMEADWLILPTQAECYGLVFAEASGYALPSLATAVGGVPTAILNGRNGFVFSLDTPLKTWVDTIDFYWKDREAYRALAMTSRAEFLTRLNWKVAGQTALKQLNKWL